MIRISIKRQDEIQGEVLLLHSKGQGKSLLMSWRVQQERRMTTARMAKSRQDVVGVNYVKDATGQVFGRK